MLAIHRLVRPQDLSVVFQPIVDLRTGVTFAQEALVRCSLPEIADPPTLFRQAIQARCAGRLGRMIREIAIPLCSGIPVFVNIHPAELGEPWLVRPDDAVFTHDTDVYLEITESVPLTHFDRVREVVREIRARGGIELVIDDLGAGYSNLKRIADLEPKVVKLDRGLIEGCDRSDRQRKLMKGVVDLCRDLGADVVGEGIETEAELDAVRAAGVQYGQGYLFARPGFPIPAVTIPPSMSASLPPPQSVERARRRTGAGAVGR